MNTTQAKIIMLCDNLHTNLRYAEYIASRIGMSYDKTAAYLRSMKNQGWVKFSKTKNKVIITSVNQTYLEQAKEVLKNGAR